METRVGGEQGHGDRGLGETKVEKRMNVHLSVSGVGVNARVVRSVFTKPSRGTHPTCSLPGGTNGQRFVAVCRARRSCQGGKHSHCSVTLGCPHSQSRLRCLCVNSVSLQFVSLHTLETVL
ncbi:hypothetical protein Pmani_021378 [Petrolisthes manimaculis]|uniref:Uncharacterized protein n=1 Tax=Petrolisthes manimaculis TaxID=1843537 RepID=A0AAE1U5J0_9EUCA|nr:hypothetical protein Pmani_021378 [Petrolisthes manimaculis]